MVPSSCQTLNQANSLGLTMSLTVGCYHLRPPPPLVIIQPLPYKWQWLDNN